MVTYEGRLTWLIVAAAAPAAIIALAILWFGDYSAKVQWTLTLLIGGIRFGILHERARTHRPSVADDDQSAGRFARRRLLDPRPRRAGGRRARRSVARRSMRSAKPCACSVWARSKRRRCCARSWRRSMSPFSLSIPSDVCVWSIAPAKICSAQPMDKLLGRRASDLGLTACLRRMTTRR